MSGERQQPTGRSRPTWWLWGLVGAVVVAGVGGGLIGAAVASPSPGTTSSASSAASCAVTPVADKVQPSVVTISATPASGKGGTHSYFGLETVPMPEAAAKEAGITGGLFVAGVVAGGPAEKTGLQTGDVITTVDGKQATSNIQLQEVTLTKNPGETVELGYLRNGEAEKATVTLGAQP